MASNRLAVTGIIVLMTASFIAYVRHGRELKAESFAFEPQSMKDYKKPSAVDLKKKLSAEQFAVTQQCGTEPAFHNAYWDNHKPGIYVDVVSGEPLFSSLDKFDSGTGWPSFIKPLKGTAIVEKKALSVGGEGPEARSPMADSH